MSMDGGTRDARGCRWTEHGDWTDISNGNDRGQATCLNATTMWPLDDTGWPFSRYAVMFSSRHSSSHCAAVRGESDSGEAAWTMLHIGHPGRAANAIVVVVKSNSHVIQCSPLTT